MAGQVDVTMCYSDVPFPSPQDAWLPIYRRANACDPWAPVPQEKHPPPEVAVTPRLPLLLGFTPCHPWIGRDT